MVRADGRLRSIDEIARAVVATRGGVSVTVGQVASVQTGGELRMGAASHDGHEAVIGSALMLVGANSRTVAHDVRIKLEAVARTLPTGVRLVPLLDRSQLVNATITTVARNLIEGALLVEAILFFLLGNWRAALIATFVIPLSLLMSATGMNELGISGNLMSLGALDFGLIVDGAVIIVENCLRRLGGTTAWAGPRTHACRAARRSDRVIARDDPADRYGQIVIFLVFVPCLTFQGVEGKMFSPMVITLMLALASAFVLSLTFVPALIAVLLKGASRTRRSASSSRPSIITSPGCAAPCIGRRPSSARVSSCCWRDWSLSCPSAASSCRRWTSRISICLPCAFLPPRSTGRSRWTSRSSERCGCCPRSRRSMPRPGRRVWRRIRCRPTPPIIM